MTERVHRLETARLVAEPISIADFDDLCALWSDPRVTATLGGPRGPDNIRLLVAMYEQGWAQDGFGEWAWRDRTNGTFVGRAGLRRVEVDGAPEIEVGYAIVADRWGEGLATEATRGIVGAAFDDLGLDDVVAFTLPTNVGSQRVMRKAGFVYEKDVMWADLPHVLFRLRRAGSGEP